jgi:hypothetical protein
MMRHQYPAGGKRFCARLALPFSLSCLMCCMPAKARADEAERSRWALQFSGFTHHFGGTQRRAHPHWNSVNTGIGLQYDLPPADDSRWSTSLSIGEMKDSYGVIGPYVGVARFFRLNDGRIRSRLGIGGFLAYRALDWDYRRKLTFLPMPVLSVEDRRSGLGFNVTGSPAMHYDDRRIASFLFIQGFWRF